MKKINFTSVVLLIYLLVMAVIGWPGKKLEPDYTEYFCVIGATALIICVLRFVQIKRFKIREQARNEKKQG